LLDVQRETIGASDAAGRRTLAVETGKLAEVNCSVRVGQTHGLSRTPSIPHEAAAERHSGAGTARGNPT